ncbi:MULTISPECIES: adenylate cyclase [unclassified Mesorhizobium]|uniref:adenylate cyclase n=1 Tax=unclassified Mesorhizobium TaxID=325217 RepID=UPI000FCC9703|nr:MULTISPECIES: adenylate cyclase [unclassified Mesorhizobium]TGU96940.1 adenylate cyclase [Mesorhizobium sp. M00.F.Ca.ET.151.01.1.1]TGV58058.1 adenylate cyclase [bacterium M00.F.Ca.ET.141.01.1.1]TIU50219.1 MAG: adenylate cyclase [Mesorhizobium sp.]RUW56797.1 adenylate cyclase [Mesorhizobium sp. M8A.F.Ca.ET.021.01.1.1]TGP91354.1 adenylate cyclase [Mesorhizobium sp. M8A.F.Ca.ET.218.01.1.1]
MNVFNPGVAALALTSALRLPPSPEEVRAELERILSSPEFSVPARACAFLRYVVEETLSGRATRLKGYSIAIEVFDRDENFSQDDPVVRIEAGRLRRALERYYLLSGCTDPIRIEIPKGGYVPVFSWNVSNAVELTPVGPAAAPEISKAASFSWERVHWLATATLAVVVCLTFAYWASSPLVSQTSLPSTRAADPEGPTLVVAPFADLGGGPEAKLYAMGLTEELLSILPHFKELTVYGRETSEALPPQVAPSHIQQLGASYLLTGGVQISGARIRVTARLIETENGAILWSQTYDDDFRSRDIFAIQSDVAAQVATVVAQPYGVIYQADIANGPPDDLDAYRCTLQFYAYRTELSVERHAAVRDCLESAVARFPSYATAWAMLSIAYVDEDRFGFNARKGAPTSAERALAAARRAVELNSDNMRALQALMTALFFNQQWAESMEIGERALALNPNDTEFLGEFGTRLALGGQWQRGAELVQLALDRNPGAGGYYHTVLALTAYMQHDDQKAVAEIRQADLQKLPIFHVVATAIYAQAGMMAEATREGEIFMKMSPAFIPNIEAELMKRNIQAADRARMIASLRKAGLPVPSDAPSGSSVPATTSDMPSSE